jgi:hypothetical protein
MYAIIEHIFLKSILNWVKFKQEMKYWISRILNPIFHVRWMPGIHDYNAPITLMIANDPFLNLSIK